MTIAPQERCPGFGTKWSASDPMCAGGKDPLQPDGVRERCTLFGSCGAAKQGNAQAKLIEQAKAQAAAPEVRVQLPIAPPQPTYQTPQPTYQAPAQPPSILHHQQPPRPMMQLPQLVPYQPPATPTMTVQAPMQVPMQQMMPVSFAMPSYLSTPEPLPTNPTFNNYMGMVGVSLLRAMLKAAGHTLANVFDTIPFGGRKE